MEKQSLTDFLNTCERNVIEKSEGAAQKPWYNPYGDCVEFQTTNVAIVAKRIDEFLTIYNSAETGEAIGFQLKDVRSFIEMAEYDGFVIQIETKEEKFISLVGLFLKAIEKKPASVSRRKGYQQAMHHLPHMNTDQILMTATQN